MNSFDINSIPIIMENNFEILKKDDIVVVEDEQNFNFKSILNKKYKLRLPHEIYKDESSSHFKNVI